MQNEAEMRGVLGNLGQRLLYIAVIVLPLMGLVKFAIWHARWAERHGIQIGATEDDDDDDSPFDSWWQAPPPTFRP